MQTRRKILIVEDAKFWRDALSERFAEAGYDVRQCDDGMIAIEIIKRDPPDAVVLDYLLPRVDGGRICTFIKAHPELQRVVTVVITGAVVGGLRREDLPDADAVIAKGPPKQTLPLCVEVVEKLLHGEARDEFRRSVLEPAELHPREMTLKLLKLKEYIDTLQTELVEAVFELDAECRIVRVNPRAARLVNESESTLLGSDFLRTLELAEEHPLAIVIRTACGDPESIESGPFTHTFKKFQLESTVSKIPYVLGKVGMVVIIRDATDRKQAEANQLETEKLLLRSQKLEAIGRLAGGIAHDFNNLLTTIMGYADLIEADPNNSERLRTGITEIKRAAGMAAGLTSNLLSFARKQVVQPRNVNLNHLISGMLTMLRPMIGEDVELVAQCEKALGAVLIDPTQVEQIIVNLVVNARDAMPSGGKVVISTWNYDRATSGRDGRAAIDDLPKESYVVLEVQDEGTGIEPDVVKDIFDPFFTTKEEGKGSGLGLATVYGIVAQCSGEIRIDSRPGHGTAFRIFLPRCDLVPLPVEPSDSASRKARGGNETILLVEDNETIRQVALIVLREAGYSVLEASRGEAALMTAHSNNTRIDLLLTDLVMPGLNGMQLAGQLKAERPEIRLLYISGYSHELDAGRGPLNTDVPLLKKPFKPTELLEKVREVLDAIDEQTPHGSGRV